MTDRELLELAAHAAGIPTIQCTCSDTRWPFKHDEEKSGKRGHWNPLEDDGDALRLAVRLELKISHRCVDVDVSRGHASASEYVPTYFDRAEATRRAIVRAAAEIGRRQAAKATGRADSGDGSQKETP